MTNNIYLDTAFVNGSVITVNKNDDICEAVGVKNGKISYVGDNEGITDMIGEETNVIDLKGRTLMPGINDSHYHPILNGMIRPEPDAAIINTSIATAQNFDELFDIIRKAATLKQSGDWISCMGHEAGLLEEQRHPALEELDQVYPDGPLQLITANGHNGIYNSKALEYIGVYGPDDACKYPNGEVCVDAGHLTGEVKGHTHFELWSKVGYTEEQQKKAALKSQEKCFKHGITSVGDMGECGSSSYHLMQKLCRSGEFKVRTYMAIHSIFGKPFSMEENDHWLSLGLMTGLGDEHFRIGPCKFMIDGGSGGPTCYTREPYSHDPAKPYEKAWNREETWDYIKKIDQHECQCTAHAMGDGAIEYMIEGYERAYDSCDDKEAFKSRRHRIEHCMIVDQDLINRMAVMNICPSVNAGLQIRNGKNLAKFYGPQREKYIGALRSMLDAGIVCSLHSDAPSGPYGFNMIAGAVTRYDKRSDYQCSRAQAVSLLEAIRCCTINAAYQSYEEDKKGSIEAGKLADLIVTNCNILDIDPMELSDVIVEMTMIDGEIVWVNQKNK